MDSSRSSLFVSPPGFSRHRHSIHYLRRKFCRSRCMEHYRMHFVLDSGHRYHRLFLRCRPLQRIIIQALVCRLYKRHRIRPQTVLHAVFHNHIHSTLEFAPDCSRYHEGFLVWRSSLCFLGKSGTFSVRSPQEKQGNDVRTPLGTLRSRIALYPMVPFRRHHFGHRIHLDCPVLHDGIQ